MYLGGYSPFTTANVGDNWIHVTAVRTGSTCEFYLNGALEGSYTFSANTVTSTGLLYLYSNPSGSSYTGTGHLKDVRIYNKALTQSQITRIYNGLARDKSNV